MIPDRVPREAAIEILERALHGDSPCLRLCESDAKRVTDLRRGECLTISFDVLDRILCRLDSVALLSPLLDEWCSDLVAA